jgi:Na+/H+ antiporter NhaD/arsenite permease-like protein
VTRDVTPLQQISEHFDPLIYISLAFLFGIAAQFKVMHGSSFLKRILTIFESRFGVLYAVIIVTSLFSPLILNDVVILILTPVLISYSKEFEVDIAPLIVAEITFTNIASTLTPLGNPQNILLWQASGIPATDFVLGTWLPLLISGVVSAAVLYPLSRKMKNRSEVANTTGSSVPAIYLLVVIITIFSSDILGISSVLALAISFMLGFIFTFRSLQGILKEFDLRSLLILYTLVASITIIGVLLEPFVISYASQAASGVQPFSALFIGGLSNLISNVPTTQLILSLTTVSPHQAPEIAVEAGLAGNIDPIGSFANLLALLLVRRAGLQIKRAMLLQLLIGLISFLPAFI